VTVTCKCGTPNEEGAIFCSSRDCGALLEWSASPPEGARGPGVGRTPWEDAGGASPGAQAATAEQAPPREPGREYEPPPEHAGDEVQEPPPMVGQLVCPKCGSGNWPHVRFCRRCGAGLESASVAAPPPRLPGPLGSFLVGLAYRREKDPLPAGQRKRPRNPFLGRDPMVLLHTSLKVLAILLIVGAACIGGLWVWHSTLHPRVVSWYASSREALFPRFRSVSPAMIFYTAPNCVAGVAARPDGQRRQLTPTRRAIPNQYTPVRATKRCRIKSTNSIAEAFDKNLNTFWLSPTPRGTNDRIAVRFQPQADIAAFTIYAGDPTGEQVVPQNIQMTFYGPAEIVYYPAPVLYPAPKKRENTLTSTRRGLYWPVTAVRDWTLLDTQAQQRFSTGDLTNIARVVITIRGNYPNANRKATQALTEVEFFDKY
jgi:hypothetical protein